MVTAFFSPTGTTRTIILKFSAHLKEVISSHDDIVSTKMIDFTPLSERVSTDEITMGRDELFILGIPVYAGRVPNVLLPYLNRFKGDQTKTIIVAVYGNRHFDDALMELSQILNANGFDIIAGCAFIGEHAFSKDLAVGRPDADDLQDSNRFARLIADKLDSELITSPEIPGNWPLRPYYKPVDGEGVVFDFKRIVPTTMSTCIDCGYCANICPVQSISFVDNRTISGICIKCCACVKQCPVNAKQFDDPNFIKHKKELESDFVSRKSPECYL
jgi:ferredoxin